MTDKEPKTSFFDLTRVRIVGLIGVFSVLGVLIVSTAYVTVHSPQTTTISTTQTLSTYTTTKVESVCMNQYLQNGSALYQITSCPTSRVTLQTGFNLGDANTQLAIVIGLMGGIAFDRLVNSRGRR